MTNYEKAIQLKKTSNFLIRTCWDCNGSHEHLKYVSGLYTCFDCGRWYMNNGFFDDEIHCKKKFIQLPEKEFIKIQLFKNNYQ